MPAYPIRLSVDLACSASIACRPIHPTNSIRVESLRPILHAESDAAALYTALQLTHGNVLRSGLIDPPRLVGAPVRGLRLR